MELTVELALGSLAVVAAPPLLAAVTGAGTDGTQVLLLPLGAHLVRLTLVVTPRLVCRETTTCTWSPVNRGTWTPAGLNTLTWFTLELALAVSQAGAAHQVTVFCLSVPTFTDPVIIPVIMTPLCITNTKQLNTFV